MARGGRQSERGDDGFGLVEVMLSLSVLLIVLVSSSYLVDTTVKQAAINREKVAAAELAEKYLETTANSTLSSLQANISKDVLLTATPVTIGGVGYSVWSHLEWAATGTQPSLCTSGNPPQVVRATMTVKWGNGQSLGETTVINPPYGALVPGDGFLSVQIQGASAPKAPADTANLVRVAVNVTPNGGSTTTYNPDQYGCVYLQEPVGTYTVSLASPSGGPAFIDWQELAAPSQSSISVVTAGLPTFVPAFHYDESGTVALSPAAGPPVASGMPVSISNGGNLQPSGSVVLVAPGSSTMSAQLFPYTTPYSVWYGDCSTVAGVTQEQPAIPSTFTVTPQGSTSATITGLTPVSLAVTQTGGGAQAPTATATVADPNAGTDGCSASNGEVYTLAGMAGSGTAYSDQTAILPQTYNITVTDPNNNQTTTLSGVVVGANSVVYGGTDYYGASLPVTVP